MASVFAKLKELQKFQDMLETTISPLIKEAESEDELITGTLNEIQIGIENAQRDEEDASRLLRDAEETYRNAQEELRRVQNSVAQQNRNLPSGTDPATVPSYYYSALDATENLLNTAQDNYDWAERRLQNAIRTKEDYQRYTEQYRQEQAEAIRCYKDLIDKSGAFFEKYIELLADAKQAIFLENVTPAGSVKDSSDGSEDNPNKGNYVLPWKRISGKHDTWFLLGSTNPNYVTSEFEWTYNCQRCVPTYELRCRGYDVMAAPRPQGNDFLAQNPFAVWKNAIPVTCGSNPKEDIENAMRIWGDGARAQITLLYKFGGGHTFVAQQINGVTRFIDPQSGKIDTEEIFTRAKPGGVDFCRIDTLQPSRLILQCCKEAYHA